MSLTSHRCCARLKILKQAWTFSASPTITPQGSCIHRKAINKDKPSLSSGVLPSRQQYHIGTILAHFRCRCTRLLMVLPSRQQSAICHLLSYEDRLLTGLRLLSLASDGGLFCTAKGSYFVLLISRLPMGRPDGWGWSDREARFHD